MTVDLIKSFVQLVDVLALSIGQFSMAGHAACGRLSRDGRRLRRHGA
jgi:hypothetical protein